MGVSGSQGTEPAKPSPQAVREQLKKILDSGVLGGRARRGAFLRYVVEETLAGRGELLKGVSIAMSVFGRDETFDQQTDPIVRLEARRLRHDLDGYYATAGRDDPIRISIPKGGYLPRFEWQGSPELETAEPADAADGLPALGTRQSRLWLGAAVCALVVLAVAAWRLPELIGAGPGATTAEQDPLLALPKGPSIAVLPFLNLSGDDDKQYLSDGITEQLTTELARFRDLWVLPLGTMQHFRDGLVDPRALRREFGVDYVLEGSVRTSGEDIRITSRLIDAKSARYVWVKTFDEPFKPASIYEVEAAIAEEVAGNLAGKYGVLAQDDMAVSKRKPPDSLDAYDCVLRYYDYQITINPERHGQVRACLERAVALEPAYAEAWAVLANVYMQEKRFGVGGAAGPGAAAAKAKAAVKRAIELDPAEATGHMVLSNLLFTEGDLEGFRQAGEAALRLNPNNSDALAHYGLRLALSGDWDRGLALVNKAMTLNPVHPQWYRFAQVFYHYDRQEYDLAVAELEKIDMPRFFWTHLAKAAALGQLGRPQAAEAAAQDLLTLKPEFARDGPSFLRVWQFPEPLYEHLVEGLRKAGLKLAGESAHQPAM